MVSRRSGEPPPERERVGEREGRDRRPDAERGGRSDPVDDEARECAAPSAPPRPKPVSP